MPALASITGADLAAAVIAPHVPEPHKVVIGTARRGDPRREISVESQGGREEERVKGTEIPRYVRDRVRVVVRAPDRREDTDWMTTLSGLFRSVLLSKASAAPARYRCLSGSTCRPGQQPVEVRVHL